MGTRVGELVDSDEVLVSTCSCAPASPLLIVGDGGIVSGFLLLILGKSISPGPIMAVSNGGISGM